MSESVSKLVYYNRSQKLQMKYLPLSIKCVLWRHSITHHRIQESFPLSSIEAKNLSFPTKRKKNKHQHFNSVINAINFSVR